jgi:ethanolamine utilization protein EutN
MEMGTVIGNVWATRKEDDLTGLKFLVVEPHGPSAEKSFVAVDRIGAGVGDQVLVTRGSSASNMSGDIRLPIDALIIGIIDSVDVEKKEVK